jgi:DNA-binding IclR family transcriptional regulator
MTNRAAEPDAGLLLRIVLAAAERPQGITTSELAGTLQTSPERIQSLSAIALEQGVLEKWSFIPDRVRISRGAAVLAKAWAAAELRACAWPFLERMHGISGLPVTLHVLQRGAHAVIERCPHEPWSTVVANEVSRYAAPRPLRSGATAKAFLAFLPQNGSASSLDSSAAANQQFAQIRRLRYCFEIAHGIAQAAVLSAPVLSAHNLPVAALCTYGPLARLNVESAGRFGPLLADFASQLAAECGDTLAPLMEDVRQLDLNHLPNRST